MISWNSVCLILILILRWSYFGLGENNEWRFFVPLKFILLAYNIVVGDWITQRLWFFETGLGHVLPVLEIIFHIHFNPFPDVL